MNVLGLDPGLARTGYGVIRKESKLEVLGCGTIETDPRLSFYLRIRNLGERLKEIIKAYEPEVAAIEKIFFNKNIKTAILTGEVTGAIILICVNSSIEIVEYTPIQIKQAIVGYGRAEKIQMQKMLKILLGLKEIPGSDDAADALAAALTYVNSSRILDILRQEDV